MSEDTDLAAKIADLSGRIDRHKNSERSQQYQYNPPYQSYGSYQWTAKRGTPYGVPRGRGSGHVPKLNRNRTLVVNNSGQSQRGAPPASPGGNSPSTNASDYTGQGWVSKRDRHMVLINNSVYEQKSMERAKAMEQTRKQQQEAHEEQQKVKLQRHDRHLQIKPTTIVSTASKPQEIVINSVRFAITDGGSKLIKVSGESANTHSLFVN